MKEIIESHQRLNISSTALPLPTQEMKKEVNHVEITLSNLSLNELHTFHTSIAQEIRLRHEATTVDWYKSHIEKEFL